MGRGNNQYTNSWTQDEVSILRTNLNLTIERLMDLLPGRTWKSISYKFRKLGLKRSKEYWSKVRSVKHGKYNVSVRPKIITKCLLCNATIEARRKGRKFCSLSCSATYNLKGKTYIELHGAIKAKELKERISRRNFGKLGHKHTAEVCDRIRQAINTRYARGWQPKAGRCEKISYESPSAGKVLLDGTWELLVAKWLDCQKLRWVRNKQRFEYFFEDAKHYYTPDFWVEDWGTFLEVKGYETAKDREKWCQLNQPLIVFKKQEILEIKNGDIPKLVKGRSC